MNVSVVIPCQNEEKSIGKVIRSLPPDVGEIIVVDNNSHDNTARIAKRAGAMIIFEPVKGYGSALKAGFRHAKGDIIVTLDGDSQYPGGKIPEMVDYLKREGLDFVSGNRFPVSPSSMGKMRFLGNKLFTFLVNSIFGFSLKDSQSGMWVFKRQVLGMVSLKSNDMAISQEIKIKVLSHPSLRLGEYYIPYYPRLGKSKLSLVKHGMLNLLSLIRMKLKSKVVVHRNSFFDRISDWLRYRKILPRIPLHADMCDLGCGPNACLLTYVQKRIRNGIGFDSRIDTSKHGNIALKRFTIGKKIPLENESLDVVTMLALLEHLEYPQKILDESFRVLRSGGILLLTAPTPLAKPLLEFLAFRLHLIDAQSIKEHKQYFWTSSLKNMLSKAGFKKKHISHSYFECFLNNVVVAKK
ncbi:MAG: glycosyltransferase [Candidatus Portnoybacteria bacterium]|nr:glycosyltransferase [Candidatus Portnoybacteria bacterium]